jgi:hypothetical protein
MLIVRNDEHNLTIVAEAVAALINRRPGGIGKKLIIDAMP